MEQRIKDILLAPYHNPNFYWDTPDLEKATASLLQLIRDAQIEVWRNILGAGADNPEDLPDDFISVPAFWIKKQLAELKAKESE